MEIEIDIDVDIEQLNYIGNDKDEKLVIQNPTIINIGDDCANGVVALGFVSPITKVVHVRCFETDAKLYEMDEAFFSSFVANLLDAYSAPNT